MIYLGIYTAVLRCRFVSCTTRMLIPWSMTWWLWKALMWSKLTLMFGKTFCDNPSFVTSLVTLLWASSSSCFYRGMDVIINNTLAGCGIRAMLGWYNLSTSCQENIASVINIVDVLRVILQGCAQGPNTSWWLVRSILPVCDAHNADNITASSAQQRHL